MKQRSWWQFWKPLYSYHRDDVVRYRETLYVVRDVQRDTILCKALQGANEVQAIPREDLLPNEVSHG